LNKIANQKNNYAPKDMTNICK